VRELLLGPKRFTDLRAGLPHVSPDMLSARLRDLEADGLLRHHRLPPPTRAQVYELTERGRELEPVLLALGRWGRDEPPPKGAELGTDAFVIALKTVFAPANADGTYELRLGDDRFRARIEGDSFAIERGSAERPDAVIESDVGTLAQVLWHGRPASELHVQGDRRKAARFTKSFAG
jgi:DNA-binding HxlR family transcriptional regulator